jgi:hypothetical protein
MNLHEHLYKKNRRGSKAAAKKNTSMSIKKRCAHQEKREKGNCSCFECEMIIEMENTRSEICEHAKHSRL